MAADFIIKKGDTNNPIEIELKKNNSAVDLSSGVDSVKFYMKDPKADSAKINGKDMTIVDGPNGVIKYAFGSGEVDTVEDYNAEVHVNYTSGNVGKFPDDHFLNIAIINDLS